ncbi:MAG: mismatch-specific DNA-glycosylase [Anaerolineae bacterium]
MTNDVLPDVLEPGLVLVFCGTAPSRISALRQTYYGNPANRFWPTLRQIGLIPPDFDAADFRQLPRYGLGLTDMAKRSIGNDSDLKPADFDRERFVATMRRCEPRAVAFTSKKAASVYLERGTQQIAYGWQAVKELPVYVLPSPSGAATSHWDVTWWQQLADWVRQTGDPRVY